MGHQSRHYIRDFSPQFRDIVNKIIIMKNWKESQEGKVEFPPPPFRPKARWNVTISDSIFQVVQFEYLSYRLPFDKCNFQLKLPEGENPETGRRETGRKWHTSIRKHGAFKPGLFLALANLLCWTSLEPELWPKSFYPHTRADSWMLLNKLENHRWRRHTKLSRKLLCIVR